MIKKQVDLTTINFRDLVQETGNIYESTAVVSKRATIIYNNLTEEIKSKLEQFSATEDEESEEEYDNQEQRKVSTYYEKAPKPVLKSIKEFLGPKKIEFKYGEVVN